MIKVHLRRRDPLAFWIDKKDKLLKRYKNLTEKDLRFDMGNEKEMIETLCKKLDMSSQEMLNIILTI